MPFPFHLEGAVFLLTGLSASGKTTLAEAFHGRCVELGIRSMVLDGDVLRKGLCSGLGFELDDRKENVRRAAEAAFLLAQSGVIVLCSLIAPYRAQREWICTVCKTRGIAFAEVHVSTPLSVCEERDPKGLYRDARAGRIENFTGISSDYEPPRSPEIRLDMSRMTVHSAVVALETLMETIHHEN
jgi:adenylyl-sulfate kinase